MLRYKVAYDLAMLLSRSLAIGQAGIDPYLLGSGAATCIRVRRCIMTQPGFDLSMPRVNVELACHSSFDIPATRERILRNEAAMHGL